ncbi:MAG TPA: adenylate/guanylate cyclase domain-containing protein [Acidimicrobiia bacterium]|nr:adenylate/guanylate cyclase domain-containing protein [Acidimicrobiia bacterium]
MEPSLRRSIAEPDEIIELSRVTSRILTWGGMSVALDVHQPGWRWSEDVKPHVGTEWCQTHHIGYVLSGKARILLRDGTEVEYQAGDLIDLPPGHDAWVVGDEPMEMLSWLGGRTWLSPLHTLRERVLVTILFTDIVDSTGMAQRLGDGPWADLVAGHNRVLIDNIDRFRGQRVRLTGDGVLALFDGAARAVRCAIACRKEVHQLGITIRAGVHSGEVEMTGNEIHGLAVHEAARIMALASGDEILVSDLTKALARDEALPFEERGHFELRGVEGKVRLHAVSEPVSR